MLHYYKRLLLVVAIVCFSKFGFAQKELGLHAIVKGDTISKVLEFEDEKMSNEELECHKLIWSLSKVKNDAIYLRKKKVYAFSMTEERTSKDSDYFVIGFFEMIVYNGVMDHYARLETYRINKRKEIETYSFSTNTWTKVEKK